MIALEDHLSTVTNKLRSVKIVLLRYLIIFHQHAHHAAFKHLLSNTLESQYKSPQYESLFSEKVGVIARSQEQPTSESYALANSFVLRQKPEP